VTTLYTYCIPFDDGAAPNPFWGVCTLVICKPAIRRTAQIGDWVVGTGAKSTVIGRMDGKKHYADMSNRLVYAMKITAKMKMRDYDFYTQEHLREKIPNWISVDERRRLGDSLYDFSQDPPKLRPGVHSGTSSSRSTDLGGRYALLSEHFYYFGDQAVPLPGHLLGMVKQGQGHRSKANDPFLDPFEKWLSSLDLEPNEVYGSPLAKLPPLAYVSAPISFFKGVGESQAPTTDQVHYLGLHLQGEAIPVPDSYRDQEREPYL
jgi:hypothetical protein